MTMRSVVLLSRRHRLYGGAAKWNLPDVELFLFDSPAEALAKLSLGRTVVFVFDTRDYPRFKHVLRKFFSLKTDGDLIVIGQDRNLPDMPEPDMNIAVRFLPNESESEEIKQEVARLLKKRFVFAEREDNIVCVLKSSDQ